MITLTKKEQNRILYAMTALVFVSTAATDIYIPCLPEMLRFFHTSTAVLNLTISIYTLGMAIGVLFIGEISNRFGRKKTLLIANVIFIVMTFAIACTNSIGLIIGFRLIQALATSAVVIVPRLIFKECLDEREQIRSSGMLLMGLVISPAVAPVIGAYLGKYFHWQICFEVNALLALIVTLYTIKILPETNLNPIKKFAPLSEYAKDYFSIFTTRTFLSLSATFAGALGTFYAFIGVSSYLYINDWHWSPIVYSYLYLVIAAAFFVGNVYMQHLNKKHVAPLKIISRGATLTVTGMIILALALLCMHEIVLASLCVTVGVVLMRGASAVINPATQVRLMAYFSKKKAHAAQALGLNMFLGFFACSVASYLVSLSPNHPLGSLVVVSLIFTVVCAGGIFLNRRYLKEQFNK